MNTALKRVAANTDPQWAAAVDKEILRLAKSRSTFTTDDIWDGLEKNHPTVATPEHRAMGPRVTKAVKNKVMVLADCGSCGTVKIVHRTSRPEAHAHEIAIYASLVYGK